MRLKCSHTVNRLLTFFAAFLPYLAIAQMGGVAWDDYERFSLESTAYERIDE